MVGQEIPDSFVEPGLASRPSAPEVDIEVSSEEGWSLVAFKPAPDHLENGLPTIRGEVDVDEACGGIVTPLGVVRLKAAARDDFSRVTEAVTRWEDSGDPSFGSPFLRFF